MKTGNESSNTRILNAFRAGERLYLRPLEDSDISEEYLGWLNDPEVNRLLAVGSFPSTLASVRQYVERFTNSKTDFIFAIVDKETHQHIGNITLNNVDWINRTGVEGIMIGVKEYWGGGYGTEARSLMLEFAFQRLGLRKIISGAAAENKGSIKGNERLGYKVEGVLRKHVLVDGEYVDAVQMGLLREEFQPYKPHHASKSNGVAAAVQI